MNTDKNKTLSVISLWECFGEYYCFLDLIYKEDIECPWIDNPEGFNFAKANLILTDDLFESGININQFDLSKAIEILNDDDFCDLHEDIRLIINRPFQSGTVDELISLFLGINSRGFIGKLDAHNPQI